MSASDIFDIEILNEIKRRDVIINYIRKHKGCTAEATVNGQSVNGRGKTFRILHDLKKEGVVIANQSLKNRKNIRLFLNEDHPVISFIQEFEGFRQRFFQLLRKSLQFRIKTPYSKTPEQYYGYISDCVVLFFNYSNMSNFRSFAIWPSNISDPDGIKKLIILSQVKFADLYFEMTNMIKLALGEKDWDEFFNCFKEAACEKILNAFPESVHPLSDVFPEFTGPPPLYHRKLKKESKQMFGYLAKIRGDIYYSFPKTKREQYYESEEFREEQGIIDKHTDILENRLNGPHLQDTPIHHRQKQKNKRTQSSRRRKIAKIPYVPMKVYNREKNRIEEIMIPDFTDI